MRRSVIGPRSFARRHPLGAFVVLAYLFSWSYWVPVALAGGHLCHFPGLLGPMLAAFCVTFLVDVRPGVRSLLSRMFRWRVPLRWYLTALVPLAAGLTGMAVVALAENEWPTVADLGSMAGLPRVSFWGLAIVVLAINGLGEEVGWRGFAWSRLRERRSLAASAGILGLVWAGWHLPTFWIETGMNLEWFVIPGWIAGLMAGAVVLGWLYERAEFSLLIVALFHTSVNLASATAATEGIPAAATTMVVVAWAVLLLRRLHPVSGPRSRLEVARLNGSEGSGSDERPRE